MFNKINENKKLISLRMLNENTDNWLKELFDPKLSNKDEEDVFINLQDVENRIEHLKMNESKPRIF